MDPIVANISGGLMDGLMNKHAPVHQTPPQKIKTSTIDGTEKKKFSLEPPSIEVRSSPQLKLHRPTSTDSVQQQNADDQQQRQRIESKMEEGKSAAVVVTTSRSVGPPSIDPYAPIHSGESASLPLSSKHVSLASHLHQTISIGEMRRSDKLITFSFMFFTCVFLFVIAGVSVALDVDESVKPPELKCNSTQAANIECARTINETDKPTESTASTTMINSTHDCNESWQIWNECLVAQYQLRVPFSFVRSLFYTFSVVTTIGYGNVVAEGEFAQVVLVIYSIIAIPMFFEFVAFVSELVRNLMAVGYERFVIRRFLAQPSKPGGAKKREPPVIVFLRAYPDCLPFTILSIVVTIYVFAFAGIIVAFGEFDRHPYFDAFDFVTESASLIGFGETVPRVSFVMIVSPFIILGIILVGLIHAVMEEWITKPFELLVNYFTLEESRVDKPFAEQTLEDMMKLRPGEEDWPEASAEPPPRPVRKSSRSRPAKAAASPTPSPPPRQAKSTASSQQRRTPSTSQVRPFGVGRYNMRKKFDDSNSDLEN